MNLIEQLGGYSAAKTKYESRHFDLAWSDIGAALLDYRREHGIFEEGDWIIYKGELMVFALWSECAKNYAYIGYTDAEEGRLAHKDKFRHATPEEIKTGHRL